MNVRNFLELICFRVAAGADEISKKIKHILKETIASIFAMQSSCPKLYKMN